MTYNYCLYVKVLNVVGDGFADFGISHGGKNDTTAHVNIK